VPADGESRRGVVDRIVEEVAVILVGDEETEHHVPVDELPPGTGEGAIVRLTFSHDRVQVTGVEEGETERLRDEMSERLARLRRERGCGRFSADD
jgi:hypothetical protein